MRRADTKLLILIALLAALLAVVSSCSNPEDPADTTKPTVAITNPVNNDQVPNEVDVRAEASDNEKVAKVEFYIDAQLYFTDNTPPWSCYWILDMGDSGEHNLFAKAFDVAGNSKCSDLVIVTCENTPPAAVTDLAATEPDMAGDLTVSWTAPGDNGTSGTAAVYDLRYYWAPITADNWISAVRVEGEPTPQEAGSLESCDVSGLNLSRTFYFGIRTQDAAGNWSDISNVVEVTTPDLMGNPLTIDIPDLASCIAAADLNGDTYVDLAVAHMTDTDNVAIFFNAGDGTFGDPVIYYGYKLVSAITPVDVDNDGDMDLVTANYSRTVRLPTDSVSRVSVLQNLGGGYFELVNLDTYDTTWRYCQYIVWTGTGYDCDGYYSTVYYENSPYNYIHGTDSMVVDTIVNPYYSSRRGSAICNADINQDGWQDVIITNRVSTNISVLKNNGDGTFHVPPDSCAIGKNIPNSICAGDFNHDGRPDVANTNAGNDQITVFLNNGDGTIGNFNPTTGIRSPSMVLSVGDYPTSICTADVNGDGYTDLISANNLESNVSILLGTATGTFATQIKRPAGRGSRSVAVADLYGDASLELMVANNYDDNVSIMMNEGQFLYYSYNTVEFMADDGPIDIESADFDGDGDNDIAILNENSDKITILFNQTIQ